MRRRMLAAVVVTATAQTVGCATTGATYRSGVGERLLEHPPYYAGSGVGTDAAAVRWGHLPVAYQRGASHSPIFDPGHSPQLAELLDRMNRYLDSLGVSAALLSHAGSGSGSASGVPPDVQFGCAFQPGAFDEDCTERGDSVLGRAGQTMRLAVARPSPDWIAWVGSLMDQRGVDHVLVLSLEVGQYLTRQEGLAGRKVLELGTDHKVRFPWLTSLETPVSVVQLTGAVVGRDGRAVRTGAEGLLARRTSLPLSGLGAQALITDEDIASLLSARRDDLPGQPLTWEVGLRTMVRQLTGR